MYIIDRKEKKARERSCHQPRGGLGVPLDAQRGWMVAQISWQSCFLSGRAAQGVAFWSLLDAWFLLGVKRESDPSAKPSFIEKLFHL